MSKKVLFEVRERSTDGAFQIVEDENGVLQTHYGATYANETPTYIGAKLSTDGSGNTVLVGASFVARSSCLASYPAEHGCQYKHVTWRQ